MEVRCKRTLNFIIMKNHDNSCYKKDLQKPTISHISITTNDVSIEKCTCYTILPTPIHQKKKFKNQKTRGFTTPSGNTVQTVFLKNLIFFC
jgi:hypothetical protein